MTRLLFLAPLLLLAACASNNYVHYSHLKPEQILERTLVERSELRKATFITSASFQVDPKTIGYTCMLQFEADVPDNKEPVYYITIYTERRPIMGYSRFNKAVDPDGKEFLLKKEDETIKNNYYCELVSTQVTRDYLEQLMSGEKYWMLQNGAIELKVPMPTNILKVFLHAADVQVQMTKEKAEKKKAELGKVDEKNPFQSGTE